MSEALPAYKELITHFPTPASKSTKVLLDEVGGQPRREFSDSVNTCALRVSYALNATKSPIRQLKSIVTYKGDQEHLYIVGVPAMKRYLTERYGKPKQIYSNGKYSKELSSMNTQGIILFEWRGRIADFGATGHVDLAQIPRGAPVCAGSCYFISGPMDAYFWSTAP